MFQPKFDYAESIEDAAQIINAPHEPKAVAATFEAIQAIARTPIAAPRSVREILIRQVHEHVCTWVFNAGKYRNMRVMIGGEVKDWRQVESQMAALHPYTIHTGDDLRAWYTLFEEIHPFEDGNGRVGGIIIAGFSLQMFGRILVPLQ